MKVEGFTGPAGPNGFCVWMLEAVHHSQLILLMSALVEGESRGAGPDCHHQPSQSQGCPSGRRNTQPSASLVMLTPPSCTAV